MTKRPNRADLKAKMARAHKSAAGQIPILVGKPSDMPGFSAYMVGQVLVCMPTLLPTAPKSVKRRYLARIVANATGVCPHCGELAGDPKGDPKDASDDSIAHAELAHESWCTVSDTESSLDRWFDPAAEPMRQVLASTR
jgi:hypothetical protein